jgi:hypothetical protein
VVQVLEATEAAGQVPEVQAEVTEALVVAQEVLVPVDLEAPQEVEEATEETKIPLILTLN